MLNNVNANQFYVQITNWGLYVVRYSITYTLKGQPDVKVSSDNILMGGTRRLFFPGDSVFVTLFVEELYIPGLWAPLLKKDFNFGEIPQNRCYTCYGLSLTPIIAPVPCTNSLDLIQKQGLALQNDFLLNYYYKDALYLQYPQLLNNNCNIVTNVNN